MCSSAAGEALLNETLVRAGQLRDALKNGYSKLTAGLPRGWRAVVDESSGDTYYYHKETGETQWEVPALPKSDGAAAQAPNDGDDDGDDADEDDTLFVPGSGGRAEGAGEAMEEGAAGKRTKERRTTVHLENPIHLSDLGRRLLASATTNAVRARDRGVSLYGRSMIDD